MSTLVHDPQVDKEGLPIPKQKSNGSPTSTNFDAEGLPIPGKFKKKESGVSDSKVSPSASSTTPITKEPSTTPSASKLPSLHESIFGALPSGDPYQTKPTALEKQRDQKASDDQLLKDADKFTKTPSIKDISDDKGSLLTRTEMKMETGLTDKQKGEVHAQIVNFRNDYFNSELTPKDIDLLPGKLDGVTNVDAANAINQKTRNLKIWGNVAVMKGVQNAADQMKKLDDQIKTLNDTKSASKIFGKLKDPNIDSEIAHLEDEKAFLNHSITQVYEGDVNQEVKGLVDNLSNSLNDNSYKPELDLSESPSEERLVAMKAESPIKYGPAGTLTEKSEAYIRKYVDGHLNQHPNEIINYKTSGDLATGKRNYPDVANRVVDHFNTVLPVKKAQNDYTSKFYTDHPEFKPLGEHQQQISEYFSSDNISKANAAAKASEDKQFLNIKQKYFGEKTGIMSTNSQFQAIEQKYAERVKNGTMPEDIAAKEVESEIGQNPALKKIYGNHNKEIAKAQDDTRNLWQQFMINGLKKVDPKLTMYADGKTGLEGLSRDKSEKLMNDYEEGLQGVTDKVLGDQHKKLGIAASERAKQLGSFWAPFRESMSDIKGAFEKIILDKTGFGGEAVDMFQAKKSANMPATASDEAKKWEYQGVSSFADYKFYLSKVGGMIPAIAGAAAIGAVTKGAGLPEYLSVIYSAGLFDAQLAMGTYNDIATSGHDKYGNKLTEFDAANAAATYFKQTLVPDMFFMAANMGILSRAKFIKPTIAKEIGESLKGAAVGSLPMAWQGYLGYANKLRAEGKTPDLWDYVQDSSAGKSLIDGIIGGSILQLFHVPGSYSHKTENWKHMVYQSEGEFHTNSMYNIGLQHEMNGLGGQWRDTGKLKLATENLDPAERESVKNSLLYSTSLERNIKGGNLDISNINDAYQAHNLALADLHDHLSEQNKDSNKNLSKIYADHAKDYREQAKAVLEGKAKFHYLVDAHDQPIFLSDNAFKTLDAEGKIKSWKKQGLIKDVAHNSDPNFASEYNKKMMAEDEQENEKTPEQRAKTPSMVPDLSPEDQSTVIEALRTHRGDLTGSMKFQTDAGIEDPGNHQELAQGVISQMNDNPGQAKVMLGEDAYKKIKPILDAQKDKALQPEGARTPEESKKIIDQKLSPEQEGTKIDVKVKNKKTGEVTTEKEDASVSIAKLKERHNKLEQIINCIGK